MNQETKSFIDYKSYYKIVMKMKLIIKLGNKFGIIPDTVYKKYFMLKI